MKRTALGLTMLVLASIALAAQTPQPSPQPGPGQPDPIARLLFPPELVMQHQADIGLTDGQRATIQQALLGAQQKFMEMQWKMSSEMEKLTRLLGATPVDEAQTLEQLDRILSAERDVKKTQIGLLIRIKNTLTREQQAKLETARRD